MQLMRLAGSVAGMSKQVMIGLQTADFLQSQTSLQRSRTKGLKMYANNGRHSVAKRSS